MHPSKPEYAPALPAGKPLQGGTRRLVRTAALVVNVATGVYLKTSFAFKVSLGSTRLSLCLAVGFKPNATEDTAFPPSGPTAWLLRLDGWVRTDGEAGGFPIRANNMVNAIPIPYAQDVPTTGLDQIRGTVTVPNSPGAGVVPGTLYVNATFEPAPGESSITEPELAKLFQTCRIEGIDGGQVSVTGA